MARPCWWHTVHQHLAAVVVRGLSPLTFQIQSRRAKFARHFGCGWTGTIVLHVRSVVRRAQLNFFNGKVK